MTKGTLPPLKEDKIDSRDFGKMSRRGILSWIILSASGFGLLRAIYESDTVQGLAGPLRKSMELQDGFWKSMFDANKKAPTTPSSDKLLRFNGDIGIDADVTEKTWRLHVQVPQLGAALSLSLDEIKSLPATTLHFEFKCIEGWSQNVSCRGVKVSDFMKAYNIGFHSKYAQLSTVNGEYYVSMDQQSLTHDQTLLCYEIAGQELTYKNGYPLRLMSAVKYGVKSIKQIGSIAFTDSLPKDYWAERGYGDYLGL